MVSEMRRSNASLALSLILVFASGAVVGALGYRYYSLNAVIANRQPPRNPDEYRRAFIAEMKSRLKLSDAQFQSLDAILDNTRARVRDLREKQRPEMKAIQDEQTAQINAMLTPAQQTEYALMRKERDDKRQADEKKQHDQKGGGPAPR